MAGADRLTDEDQPSDWEARIGREETAWRDRNRRDVLVTLMHLPQVSEGMLADAELLNCCCRTTTCKCLSVQLPPYY